MRTLKKSLSLVLVLAMVFSFCAMGTSAAFVDSDEISAKYNWAVETMNSLGVLKGDERGFRPADTLTRAEACVIITKMLGAADIAKSSVCTFDDAANHWAAPYIGYCYNEGIVSGVGDNNFAPDEKLSGYAFALMILRACGYEPKNENWNADQWELCTVKLAKEAGLITKVDDISAATFTREMAAQMAFEGIFIANVSYTGGSVVTLPGGTSVTTGATRGYLASLAASVFDINLDPDSDDTTPPYVVTTITDIELDLNPKSPTFNKLVATTAGSHKFVVDSYDMMGQAVAVYQNATTATAVVGYTTVSGLVEFAYPANATTAQKIAFWTALGYTNAQAATLVADGTTTTLYTNYNTGVATQEIAEGDTLIFTWDQYGVPTLIGAQRTVATLEKVDVAKNEKTGYITANFGLTTVYQEKAVDSIDVDDSNIDWASYYNVDPAKSFGYFSVIALPDGRYLFSEVETVTGKVTADGGYYLVVDGAAYYADWAVIGTTDNTGISSDSVDFTHEFTLFLSAPGVYFATKQVEVVGEKSDIHYIAATYATPSYDAYNNVSYKYFAQAVDMEGKVSSVEISALQFSGVKEYTVPDGDLTDGKFDADAVTHNVVVLSNANANGYAPVANGDDYDAEATYYTTDDKTPLGTGLYTFSPVVNKTYKSVAAVETALSATVKVAQDSFSANTALTVLSESIPGTNLTGTNKIYVNADTKYIFADGTLADIETKVVKGGINFTVPSGSLVVYSADAARNLVASYVIIADEYVNAGTSTTNVVYIASAASMAVPYTAGGQDLVGYSTTIYNCVTGEKSTVIADASVAAGFYTFVENDGIYSFTGKRIAEGAAPAAPEYGSIFASFYGTKLTDTEKNIEDVEAGKAVIVDLRGATAKAEVGVDTIETLADIAAAKKAGFVVYMDVYAPTTVARNIDIIFIKEVVAEDAVAVSHSLEKTAENAYTFEDNALHTTKITLPKGAVLTAGPVSSDTAKITVASTTADNYTEITLTWVAAGESTITFTVKAADGTTTQAYSWTVTAE